MIDLKNSWGGYRNGSGRKNVPERNKKKGYTFQLTEDEVKFIESFDGKNRSDSLRNMINKLKS